MTRRDDIRNAVSEKLTQEIGAPSMVGSELTEVLEYSAEVEGRSVTAIVTKYPEGENPGAYQGRAGWTVLLSDDEGNELDRFHNPEPSLDEAFGAINWDNVRTAFRGE